MPKNGHINFVDPIPEENWNAIGWTPNMVDRVDDYEVVWMTPEVFLHFVDPNFRPSTVVFRSGSVDWLKRQVDKGRKFAPVQVWATRSEVSRLKRGTPTPPPVGEVRRHEGRHRAWLARQLSMPEIPVVVWTTDRLRKLKAKLLLG